MYSTAPGRTLRSYFSDSTFYYKKGKDIFLALLPRVMKIRRIAPDDRWLHNACGGLSWKRLRADEMGGERASARRQKRSEEGQDMRNPWHQTQLRGRSKHMPCVRFILKCTASATQVMCSAETGEGEFDVTGGLSDALFRKAIFFKRSRGSWRWPRGRCFFFFLLGMVAPLNHQLWSKLQHRLSRKRSKVGGP